MNCPYCKEEMLYREKEGYWVCPKDLGEWWPAEKPERGEYKKAKKYIDSPELMIWHEQDINYKPPLPAGAWKFGGGSKSGKKRKKPLKRIVGIPYET